MDVHSITEATAPQARQAIRDILYLYNDAVTSYAGFGHNLDTGSFDPFLYVSCRLEEPPGQSVELEVELLRRGAACALLCHLSDFLDESNVEGMEKNDLMKRIRTAAEDGHLDWVPLAREAVLLAFRDEAAFRAQLEQVYDAYILGYFRTRLGEG